ncbi:hypothetical protein F2P45_23015 [Massilia sp. CCM 8733]|uniref:Uncharacterized protein n=1 Tax=Massilia mucilaginosa TaxID=2609282 RepID=A0ABX0NY43_9BURK|nr:hypothetical protein [Massilia mucilaginosa]
MTPRPAIGRGARSHGRRHWRSPSSPPRHTGSAPRRPPRRPSPRPPAPRRPPRAIPAPPD